MSYHGTVRLELGQDVTPELLDDVEMALKYNHRPPSDLYPNGKWIPMAFAILHEEDALIYNTAAIFDRWTAAGKPDFKSMATEFCKDAPKPCLDVILEVHKRIFPECYNQTPSQSPA